MIETETKAVCATGKSASTLGKGHYLKLTAESELLASYREIVTT